MINLPNINTRDCPIPSAPDGNCPDPRCADADFAAANPDICPGGRPPASAVLVLKPSTLLLCPTSTSQLATYVAIDGSEQPVPSGVTYTSSNPAVATVNASTGLITGVADGIVTVSAQWQGLNAYAQVSVVGSGSNCCDGIKVAMVLVIDRSKSMSLAFGGSYATKLACEKALAADFAAGLNTNKDAIGVEQFADSVETLTVPISDIAAITGLINGITQDTDNFASNIYEGVKQAVKTLDTVTADVKVIILMSDGNLVNPTFLQGATANDTIAISDFFKSSGGIIVGVGVRAMGDGYLLMNRIASQGYFLNALPDNADETFDNLNGLKGYFCAGSCHSTYGSGCLSNPPSSQVPDPNPQTDNESGITVPPPSGPGGPPPGGPPPPPAPQLPPVVFTPVSGTGIGSGLTVALSVPGYPAAHIRFTNDGTAPPLDPSFTFPSGPLHGIDYDGSNVSLSYSNPGSGHVVYVKAIARLAGFLDSPVSNSQYTGS